jgi:FkbM family methyltransferase
MLRDRTGPPSRTRLFLYHVKARSIFMARSAAGYLIAKSTKYQIPHYDLKIDTSGAEFSPQMRAMLYWRRYEDPEIRMIRRHLRGANTVVELGASLGVTTAHIATMLPHGGQLVCVEANPRLIDGMQRRVAPHARHIALEIETLAISDDVGTANLRLTPTTPGSHLVDGAADQDTITVHTMPLRELLTKHAITEYDLVCDIEGAESSFLLGDTGALDGCRRAVFEFHDTTYRGAPVSEAELLDAARTIGFRVLEKQGRVVAMERR